MFVINPYWPGLPPAQSCYDHFSPGCPPVEFVPLQPAPSLLFVPDQPTRFAPPAAATKATRLTVKRRHGMRSRPRRH